MHSLDADAGGTPSISGKKKESHDVSATYLSSNIVQYSTNGQNTWTLIFISSVRDRLAKSEFFTYPQARNLLTYSQKV